MFTSYLNEAVEEAKNETKTMSPVKERAANRACFDFDLFLNFFSIQFPNYSKLYR